MAKIQELQDKWMVLSKRERWMIFGAGFFAVVGIMDTFMLEPLRQQGRLAEAEVLRLQDETSKAQTKITDLKLNAQGKKTGLQIEIEAAKEKLKLQQDAMVDMSAMMVKPTEVLPLLRELLRKHDEVEVVSVESLPVDNFIKKHALGLKALPTNETTTSSVPHDEGDVDRDALNQVYQHTIKLTIRGHYLAVMNYAYDLKKQVGRLSWESAEMKSQYPKTELTIYLYTLSMQNAWLGI